MRAVEPARIAPQQSVTLAHFNQARSALERARTIDEVKDIRDKAEALRLYTKQAGESLEMQNMCAEIKLRAERRAGELLREMDKNEGGDPTPSHHARGFPPTLSDLGINYSQSSRWQTIAGIPEETFEAHLAETVAMGRELTSAGAFRLARREENARRTAEVRARQIEIPNGKYSCIVVDPPWSMEKIERDERPNQVGFDYPTMNEEELKAFPLPEIAADDCHLYLWTTHKHLPLALHLAEHWGFKYQCLMTWAKNVGFTPFSWMYSTEHILFCRRGNLPLEKLGLRLDFSAKVREHSRKPDEFYEIVRQVSPGPRIDVFSRESREGFDQWGNEAGKFREVRHEPVFY